MKTQEELSKVAELIKEVSLRPLKYNPKKHKEHRRIKPGILRDEGVAYLREDGATVIRKPIQVFDHKGRCINAKKT